MIVDSEPAHFTMTLQSNSAKDLPPAPAPAQLSVQDRPPAYETEAGSPAVRHAPLVQPASDDPYTFLANLPRPQNVFSPNLATSSLPPSMPVQPVYTYKNPNTGEHIMSLLPPIHPEMICLQEGNHIKYTKYGWKGIVSAIFLFPVGFCCCMMDRKIRCKRCGRLLDAGF